MIKYIYSIITDRRRGPLTTVVRAALGLASFFYGAGSRIIRLCYRLKLFKQQKVGCRVVSVGNISLGGTGKSPTACMIARKLKGFNRNVAVLTRGYGDDEWKMMEGLLKGIPVVVGQDRVKNSENAVLKFGVDTVVLDDGFQHWKIKRDLDIVLVDSTNPFGNAHLFPRGVLREMPTALKRADILILTKTDMNKNEVESLRHELASIKPGIPILESIYRPRYLHNLADRKEISLSRLKTKKIACLAGIVNVEYFEFMLKNLGAEIELRFYYPDHYRYKNKDISLVTDRCGKEGIGTIVTTEKDAVKLSALGPALRTAEILVLHVEPEVIKGEEILDERLHSLYRA